MPEFYLDERPKPQEPSQWGGGGDSLGIDWKITWGRRDGGGDSSGNDGTIEDPWYIVSAWNHAQTEVFLNGEGFLQGCYPWVLKGDRGCMDLIIKGQIKGNSSGSHIRCILLSFSMTERAGSASNPFDWLFGNVPVINGTMTIRAKWQSGHWNYAAIHTVRFKLLSEGEDGPITPWIKLPLGEPYVDIATIDVVHGQLVLNSLRLV